MLSGDAVTSRSFARRLTRGAGAPEVEGVASYFNSCFFSKDSASPPTGAGESDRFFACRVEYFFHFCADIAVAHPSLQLVLTFSTESESIL
jgi:hypothetical protein